ncbi:hypothetical protein ACJBU6_08426 [Exserohilum turcicum]
MRSGAAKQDSLMRKQRKKNSDALTAQPVVKATPDDTSAESDAVDETAYRPRPQLPRPHVHMRSLASLMKDLDSGNIDINPEYQRGVEWPADRMTGLIDSLMENYYIPPIILNKKTSPVLNDGNPRDILVCVDGKQRLSSVQAFVKGIVPCHDHRGDKWWFCDTAEIKHTRVLPEETQKIFLNKDFITFQFSKITLGQEEDLFSRVQMGIQLTAAEKIRAKSGPWQELAKLFVEDFPAVYGLLKDRTRAKDFQLTLSCFNQIHEVLSATSEVPAFKANHAALPKLLNNTAGVDDATKSLLAGVWTTFSDLVGLNTDIFTNASGYLRGVQTFAPVEMLGVTVLLAKYSETRHHALLLEDIKSFRIILREHFSDLRLKRPTWKFVWEFIADLEAIRGTDGTAIAPTLQEQPSTSTTVVSSSVLPAQAVQSSQTNSNLQVPSNKRVAPETISEDIFPQQNLAVIQNGVLPLTLPLKRQRSDSNSFDLPVQHGKFQRENGAMLPTSNHVASAQRHMILEASATKPFSTQTASSFPSHFPPTVPVSQSSSTQSSLLASFASKTKANAISAYSIASATAASTSQGPFAALHTEEDIEGVIVPASPQMPLQAKSLAPTTTQAVASPSAGSPNSLVPPRSNTRKRKPVSRLTLEQINGAIDLTSDT